MGPLISLWFPVVAALALSFWLSSRPGGTLPSPVPDYVAHFIEYSLLALVTARAFHGGLRAAARPMSRVLVRTTMLCLLWAISDELHQGFVPGRTVSMQDLLVDLAGILAACALFPRLLLPGRAR